ncbi:MAG: phage holin family protein [Verrucomicrobiota bacterium]
MPAILLRWLAIVVALFIAAHLPFLGIAYSSWQTLLVAGLILGLLNAFVRPLLLIFTLPLVIFTLGLFIWVVNALLLLLVSYLMGDGFVVPNFWSALGGALIISLVGVLLPSGKKKGVNVRVYRSGPPRGRNDNDRRPPPGKGPVIDI